MSTPNPRNKISKHNSPRSLSNDNKPQTSSSSAPQGAHQSNLNQTRPISCFLCKGPHYVAECPHRGSFTAFKAFLQCSNDSEAKTEVEREDERDTRRMGALKLLSTIQNKASHQKDAFKNVLMFVDAVINSKPEKSTMVDSGTTHNFISEQEAHQLELKIEIDIGKMKVVNSEALSIVGVSKKISIHLGEWREDVDLLIVCMDDFNVELGMEFLLQHEVIPMPLA